MTKKEYVERNIGMTFDFVKYLIDHPDKIESLPNGAELDFIDKDMPFKINKQGGKELRDTEWSTYSDPFLKR